MVILNGVREWLGDDHVITSHWCPGVGMDVAGGIEPFVDRHGESLHDVRASFVVGAEGIKSVLRCQFSRRASRRRHTQE